MIKRKHKRQLDWFFNTLGTLKTIIVVVIIFIVCLLISGEYSLKSIYYSMDFNTINKSDTLYVVGDNTVNYSDLTNTKQIIESYFGLNVKISDDRIVFDSDLFDNKGYLMGSKTLTRFDDENDKIIITNYVCKNYDNQNISGVSEGELGNTVLVTLFDINSQIFKETVIHEISHNFGLDHCDKYNCLMYWSNSHLGKHDMCNTCRKELLEKLNSNDSPWEKLTKFRF
jgi:hypothetical protein